jgi:nickel-dependent lactate racemase
MHRASTCEEKVEMYGQEIVDQYTILDHDCENNDLLESIGKTKRETNVYVNRDFYFADLKIATGLVESHFFTGISGGRKTVCPLTMDDPEVSWSGLPRRSEGDKPHFRGQPSRRSP